MDIIFEELKWFQETFNQSRKIYDYPIRGKIIPQMLPIPRLVHDSFMEPLRKVSNGDNVETKGFLSYQRIPIASHYVKLLQRSGIDTKNGFSLCGLNSSNSGIESFCLAATIETIPWEDYQTPLLLNLKKLGTLGNKNIFFLNGYQRTSLSLLPSKVDFQVLGIKDMQRSLMEVSTTLGKKDEHVANSILSNYVGAKTYKNATGGVGSSYLGVNHGEELKRLYNALSVHHIPLPNFGIKILFDMPIADLNTLRENNFRGTSNFSWNIRSDEVLNILRGSEFKYSLGQDSLGIEDLRNLENNQSLIQSILFYSMKGKGVEPHLLEDIVKTAIGEIRRQITVEGDDVIKNIINVESFPSQVGRIASYHSNFFPREDDLKKKVEDTVSKNIQGILGVYHYLQVRWRSKEAKSLEESVGLEALEAFYKSDKTKEGIIDKLTNLLGIAEKEAEEIFKGWKSNGQITTYDGITYRWTIKK